MVAARYIAGILRFPQFWANDKMCHVTVKLSRMSVAFLEDVMHSLMEPDVLSLLPKLDYEGIDMLVEGLIRGIHIQWNIQTYGLQLSDWSDSISNLFNLIER